MSILSSAAFSSTSETDARPDTPVQRFYLLETFPIRVEIHSTKGDSAAKYQLPENHIKVPILGMVEERKCKEKYKRG